MPGGSIFRFLTLAGFIVVVAVALWLIEVGRPFVVLGVALAWAIASVYEWLAWREAEVRWPPRDYGQTAAPPTRRGVRVIRQESHPLTPALDPRPAVPETEPKPEPTIGDLEPVPPAAQTSRPGQTPESEAEREPAPVAEREPEAEETAEPPPLEPDKPGAADRPRRRFFERATAPPEEATPAPPPEPESQASVGAVSEEERAPGRSLLRRDRAPAEPPEAAPPTPPDPEPIDPETVQRSRARSLGNLFRRDKQVAEPAAASPPEDDAPGLEPVPPASASEEEPREAAPPPAPPDPPPAPPPPPPPPTPGPPKADPPRRREPEAEEQPQERPAPPRLVPPAPALPPAPREPVAVSPPPRPAPGGAPVVQIPRRVAPRAWNLWDLEAVARAEARTTPGRADEWRYLFLYLRDFARADGELPTEFDGLVRESFGNLLDRLRV